ncbi:glucose-1-phosphate adenylyltransferase [Planoprotostelium fungivorum]|uniref:Glucose-1-phosphate adenylyltransferase n=1 Tax=Planoprotostelium fungivorum TaxID=1890364 RepID=A0A2P6NUM4_9EUKA|nr:glucose-1-phosphate adenylyltransferase [Planoprotostelium fungivorum]
MISIATRSLLRPTIEVSPSANVNRSFSVWSGLRAGHSHFNNIKHKKDRNDRAKMSVFAKVSKSLLTAIRLGGTDPVINLTLASALMKARQCNFPNKNIEAILTKSSADKNSPLYDACTYEGVGPNGGSIIVEALTDNKNRTSNNLKFIFANNGGSLGATGSVGWAFERKSLFLFGNDGRSEEQVMEDVMEGGADDVQFNWQDKTQAEVQVLCPREELGNFKKYIEGKGYKCDTAQLIFESTGDSTEVSGDEKDQITRLIQLLNDDEDVQEVFHNYQIES